MASTSSNTGSASTGYFKGNTSSIFGSKPPTTTRQSTRDSHAHNHSTHGSTASRTSGFSRKTSVSSSSFSPKRGYRTRDNSISTTVSPERKTSHPSANFHTGSPVLVRSASRREPEAVSWRDSFAQVADSTEALHFPIPGSNPRESVAPFVAMLARPGTGYSIAPSTSTGSFSASVQPPSPTLETITYQHIQETSSKRISTLDYLRKAHEGRVYWFNTLLFNKPDLQKMPYFDARKLARRATNYLLLGLSLPTVIDLNSSNALEFLKTLNALLAEFESFQQTHPPDGSSSLSRGRFPQMFKRAATTASKGRRTSSAADIGLPMGVDFSDSKSLGGSTSAGASGSTSFSISENELLPGEEYTYLLTPTLPFDPDFYETFATLCDVLIDCYTRLMSLVASPRDCNPVVAEMFTKADSRVRKIIVQGVVKEFEDSSRGGVKNEVAGVGRVVLGGLL